MMKSILGFVILAAIIVGAGAYAWFYYHRPAMNQPGHELSVPEKAYKLRQKSKHPMEKFEKDMGDRVNRAEDQGIDLKKTDEYMKKLRQNKQLNPNDKKTPQPMSQESVLQEVLSSDSPSTAPSAGQ